MTQPLPVDVAEDVLSILVATGRTVDPRSWVGRFADAAAEAEAAGMPHNVL